LALLKGIIPDIVHIDIAIFDKKPGGSKLKSYEKKIPFLVRGSEFYMPM
jgi:hypothetical protein